jgi:hypothetical protein
MAGDGCQYHAGILNPDGTLTYIAKQKFIREVKDQLVHGTDNMPAALMFPCGKPVPPNPWAAQLDLENEEKFPDFHKYMLGSFEKIARALDMKSDFKFLPICCPVSLGFVLDANIELDFVDGFIPFFSPALPLLAVKLDIMPPPKLAVKLPGLPQIPPPIPKFELPTFDPELLIDLFNFNMSFILGIPKFIANLALNIPKLILKLPSVPDLFKEICTIAFDSDLFGDIDSRSIVEITSVKVLTTRVAEMSFIAATGTTVGSSQGGIVGGLGRELGYVPPDPVPPDKKNETIRERIITRARESVGLSYGDITKRQDYTYLLLPAECSSQVPGDCGKFQTTPFAENMASTASSCGMFARACLANAGCTHRLITGMYDLKWTSTIDYEIDNMPNEKRLKIRPYKVRYSPQGESFPVPLKKGDIIIIGLGGGGVQSAIDDIQHVLIVEEDHNGDIRTSLKAIAGGQSDPNNKKYGDGGTFSLQPTAIDRYEYKSVVVGSTEVTALRRAAIGPKGQFVWALGEGIKSKAIYSIYDADEFAKYLGSTFPTS